MRNVDLTRSSSAVPGGADGCCTAVQGTIPQRWPRLLPGTMHCITSPRFALGAEAPNIPHTMQVHGDITIRKSKQETCLLSKRLLQECVVYTLALYRRHRHLHMHIEKRDSQSSPPSA